MTEKEKTAPIVSVGADTEQSILKQINNSITDFNENDKSLDDYLEEMQKEFLQQLDPSHLKTISMRELYNTVYKSKPPLIDSLLYPGTYIFAGAPKLGKSFLMAQLAYHISTGTPLWNFDVRKGTVLYLALEDDYHRLQERLYRMFGTESANNLYFSVSAGQLGSGLDEQLTRFMAEHPDTKLIIIDTLQKVREVGGDNYSYANDYEIITRLKKFADSYGICLLLVHHTRKQNSEDKFDMISGTNGLLGAADGGFILRKEKRTSNSATLEVSGRDQPDQKIYLNRNPETLVWELERTETDHLHIDFVPFTTGSKRGLDTRVSLKQALAAQGFKGGTRGDTEWNQWVSAEKSALAFVMERHGIEWEHKGTHEKHLSVLDYKKQERATELEQLSAKIEEKQTEFNVLSERVLNYDDGLENLRNVEEMLDTAPEYQLSEPQGFMTAKAYKTKIAEPLIQKLKALVKTALARCFEGWDSYHRLNITNGNLYRENEMLSKINSKLKSENENLRSEVKDYKLLRKVFGHKQIDELLEQARNIKGRKRENPRSR